MTTKEDIVNTIKDWMKIENEMKLLQKELKDRRVRKTELTNTLVKIMKTNEIDCFDVNDGKLIYTQNKVKTSLSKKHITACLEKYFNNTENKELVEDLSNFILDNREVKVTETIRRKQHKNNDK